jgi:hypothetical protein
MIKLYPTQSVLILQLSRRARMVTKMAGPGLLYVRNHTEGGGGHSPAYEALLRQARENEGDRSRLVRTDQHSVS